MRKIIIYLVVLLVISPQVLLSQQTGEVNKVGTTAANFLKLEEGRAPRLWPERSPQWRMMLRR